MAPLRSENRCAFDILWCPHQDRYTAFDCRIQRFFVEGMCGRLKKMAFIRFKRTCLKCFL
jgi:hypothetical protein